MSETETIHPKVKLMSQMYSYTDSAASTTQWLCDELNYFRENTDDSETLEILDQVDEMIEEANSHFKNPTDDHDHLMDILGEAMDEWEADEKANAILIVKNDALPHYKEIKEIHSEILSLLKDIECVRNTDMYRAAEQQQYQYKHIFTHLNRIV